LWDWDRPGNLKEFIGKVNRIRKENIALRMNWNLHFCPIDNEHMIAYLKKTEDLSNIILVTVNLDTHHVQSGWIKLPLADLALDAHHDYDVHDLLSDAHYSWHGESNYIKLDPKVCPAHIFRIEKKR